MYYTAFYWYCIIHSGNLKRGSEVFSGGEGAAHIFQLSMIPYASKNDYRKPHVNMVSKVSVFAILYETWLWCHLCKHKIALYIWYNSWLLNEKPNSTPICLIVMHIQTKTKNLLQNCTYMYQRIWCLHYFSVFTRRVSNTIACYTNRIYEEVDLRYVFHSHNDSGC